MGILLFQWLQLRKDELESELLYNTKLSVENIRYAQGQLQGVLDILNFCDTLDKAVKFAQERKDKLAKELDKTRYQSQSEVLGKV